MPYEWDGDLLDAAMRDAGINDTQLACEVGCSRPLVTCYRLGYRQPPISRLITIAGCLDKTVEDFFRISTREPA
jgi:transcriptional regulator with XRE-family HTH domain